MDEGTRRALNGAHRKTRGELLSGSRETRREEW